MNEKEDQKRIVCALHDIDYKSCSENNSKLITITAAIQGSWPDHPDGGFEITESDIDDMILLHEKAGRDILFDYDHLCFNYFNNSSKAAGWGKTLRKEDGKLKIDVELTDEGHNAVLNKHYRYLSPVFFILRKKLEGVPRVMLHSVSFTNIPYLEELPPIKNHNLNSLNSFGIDKNKERRSENMDLKQLAAILKCSDTDESVLNAITALITKNSTQETQISELNDKLAENDVLIALSSGKINQNQKEFALSLRKNSPDLFNDFIKSNSSTDTDNPKSTDVPTSTLAVQNNGNGAVDLKFEELLDSPVKMEAFKNSNPVQFKKLHDDFINRGGE